MAVEFLLSQGMATCDHILWSFEPSAYVERKSVEKALKDMEDAWGGEKTMAKLSVNMFIGNMQTERTSV